MILGVSKIIIDEVAGQGKTLGLKVLVHVRYTLARATA